MSATVDHWRSSDGSYITQKYMDAMLTKTEIDLAKSIYEQMRMTRKTVFTEEDVRTWINLYRIFKTQPNKELTRFLQKLEHKHIIAESGQWRWKVRGTEPNMMPTYKFTEEALGLHYLSLQPRRWKNGKK